MSERREKSEGHSALPPLRQVQVSLLEHPDGQPFPRKEISDGMRHQEDPLHLTPGSAVTGESSHTKLRSHFVELINSCLTGTIPCLRSILSLFKLQRLGRNREGVGGGQINNRLEPVLEK